MNSVGEEELSIVPVMLPLNRLIGELGEREMTAGFRDQVGTLDALVSRSKRSAADCEYHRSVSRVDGRCWNGEEVHARP